MERGDLPPPPPHALHPIVTNFACVSLRNRMAHAQRRKPNTSTAPDSFLSRLAQVAVVNWDHSALDTWLEKAGVRHAAAALRPSCCCCIFSSQISLCLRCFVLVLAVCHVYFPAIFLLTPQEMKESSSETMFYVFGGTEPQVIPSNDRNPKPLFSVSCPTHSFHYADARA